MKQNLILMLLLIAMLLTACAAQSVVLAADDATASAPAQTAQPTRTAPETAAPTGEEPPASSTEAEPVATEPAPVTTEPAPETTEPAAFRRENAAFTERFGDCSGAILAALYNAPFADGEPEPNVVWNEGEFDRLVIYPRYVGSTVTACRIDRDEEGVITRVEAPSYRSECADGDSIAAALDRPEGGACWLVAVRTPEGAEASCVLDYNGRYGTLCYEFLTDLSAWEGYNRLPTQEFMDEFSEVLGGKAAEAFFRAAARAGLEPGEAMRRFCTPCLDIGDSASYTLCEGEMDGDSYFMEAARLHENYDSGEGTVNERAAAQAALFEQIGNQGGILGIDPDQYEALYFELTGLTVYNPTKLARRVSVRVNGLDAGSFDLSADDFCSLIPIDLGRLDADLSVSVEVRVLDAGGSDPALAILEVWPGMNGNISGAR